MTDEQRARRVWWEQDDNVSTTTYKGLRGEVIVNDGVGALTIYDGQGQVVWETLHDKSLSQRKLEIVMEKQLKKLTPQSTFNRSPRTKLKGEK